MNNEPSNWIVLKWRRHLETFGSDDNPVIVAGPQVEIDARCNLGELTDQGRKSSYARGTRLRNLYVDQLRFLPSTIRDPSMIYLRATRIPRALESLQETFGGMYPPQFRSKFFPPPSVILRAPADETLNPNEGYCKRFAKLAQAFAQRSANKWNTSTEIDYLNSWISTWIPDNSKRVAIDSQPRLSGILDTINSTLVHRPGTRLPKEFYDEKGMAIMNRLVIEEWFSGYNESQEYGLLEMDPLWATLYLEWLLTSKGASKARILLSS